MKFSPFTETRQKHKQPGIIKTTRLKSIMAVSILATIANLAPAAPIVVENSAALITSAAFPDNNPESLETQFREQPMVPRRLTDPRFLEADQALFDSFTTRPHIDYEALARGFDAPPQEARMRVWWFWHAGLATRE